MSLGAVAVDLVEPSGAPVGALVHGAVVRDGGGVDVDDGLAVPVDHEAVAVGDFTDDGGLHVPLRADLHEALDLVRLDDGHHALLRFAHENLFGQQRRVAQRHRVELNVHAAVTGRCELRRAARDAGGAEILDAGDEALGEQLQRAFDEQLLHERVAHLHAGALRRAVLVECLRREDRRAPDAVAARGRTEQNHFVADAAREREMEVFVAQHADAKRVDERVCPVGLVELHLTPDVGQAEAVAVAAHAGDDAGQDALGVIVVERAEAQRIHHCDGTGAHGEDVAHDAADAGGGALVRLDVAGVVVRLRLEGDRPALTHVDDAGLLADAREQRAARCLLAQLAELLEVHLGGLVGTVFRPHHRIHRELARGGAAAENLTDARVLVILDA